MTRSGVRLQGRRQGDRPHLFQVVTLADLGSEDVDDDIAQIDQDPVALDLTFDADGPAAFVPQGSQQPVGKRQHLPWRGAAGNDHPVCDVGFAGQVDIDDILGLAVFKRARDKRDGRRGIRPAGTMSCYRDAPFFVASWSFALACLNEAVPARIADAEAGWREPIK